MLQYDYKPKNVGYVRKQAMTIEEVNTAIATLADGRLVLQEDLKKFLLQYANKPTLVARLLANKLFTQQERIDGNCTGVGKQPMDPVRLDLLKSGVFEICCLSDSEQEKMWKNIKKAIDAANRKVRFHHSS